MRVTWINPSFLHYRVPVYQALNEMLDNNFTIIFSAQRTLDDVKNKIKNALGEKAIALEGEKISIVGRNDSDFANTRFRIPFQPGLLRAISDAQPDVIIAEGFFQWTPAALWARITRGIPLVIAYERTMHTERHAGMARTFYRKMVTKCISAICCNGILSKEYCTDVLGFPGKRIITGTMAADNDAILQKLNHMTESDFMTIEKTLSLDRPIFLYVGRLIRLKGLRELLAAWKKYNELSSTGGSLLLVGDGPERGELERTVHEQGLMHVVFTGHVDYNKIAPYYAVSDVLVMPTLEDNWSLVVPEAMACSKPILCSKYNGCWPELVHDGVNGYVFDPYDADSLAMLLKKCSDQREKLPMMGSASYEIVQAYSPQKAAKAVLQACKVAISNKELR
jgi:glycosyltransferase involved in cell wall biosynthesis